MTLPACFFAIPGSIHTLTGGYGYDRRLLQGLRARGVDMQHLALPAGFPAPDEAARAITASLLSSLPDSSIVLCDGLAYGVMDAEITQHYQRLRFIALCHHPLALETGLAAADSARLHAQERCALDMARAIVVTSRGTGDLLAAQFGQCADRITVALPGTDRHGFAGCRGSPLQLLTVATLTRRKAHDVLIEALAGLRELPWQARFVGGGEFDVEWTAHLHALVQQHGLQQRIRFVGEVQDLRDEYRQADVFVLPSLFEGYGMAFAEALSFGLPIVAARAGAVPDVVPASAGLLVEPGSSSALQSALQSLLTDTVLRQRLQQGARAAAACLPTWEDAAQLVHELMIKVSKQA
jgi:glycosyltransferase involved in cell wall biosynthesis